MAISQEEFVKNQAGICPNCQCSDIQFNETDYQGDCHVDGYTCPECRAQWSAVFTLSRYEWVQQPQSSED